MPVFLTNGGSYRPFVTNGTAPEVALPIGDRRSFIDLGLINNMSDAALGTTERQIVGLLDAAADQRIVRLTLYALPDFPRTDLGKRHLDRHKYRTIVELWNSGLDGLIVTGAEPRTPELKQESYWTSLATLFDWADENTTSTISSCLAVHAAVLHADGIDRHSLDHKCFGVFDFNRVTDHSMMHDVGGNFCVPHSRWNEVKEKDLSECGYKILSGSDQSGVDTFIKQRRSLFVYFQGHPEYEAWTLLNEYKRDIEQFLCNERDVYPTMPSFYFNSTATNIFRHFEREALANRSKKLVAKIPTSAILGPFIEAWRPTAIQVYRNWLTFLSEHRVG
jgi:homoserine O-succinyltransferase